MTWFAKFCGLEQADARGQGVGLPRSEFRSQRNGPHSDIDARQASSTKSMLCASRELHKTEVVSKHDHNCAIIMNVLLQCVLACGGVEEGQLLALCTHMWDAGSGSDKLLYEEWKAQQTVPASYLLLRPVHTQAHMRAVQICC